MFRNDDDDEKIEKVLEEKQKSLEASKKTAEANRKRAAALRESVGKTVADTQEKRDGLLRQGDQRATSPQSGLLAANANKVNPLEEESPKPKRGKGGCNIF